MMDENRDDRQNNYGYHYGEGFTMRGAMPEDYQQTEIPAEPQADRPAEPHHTQPRYYNDATYQNGYDGSYRQTYENQDFRRTYRGGKDGPKRFSRKRADRSSKASQPIALTRKSLALIIVLCLVVSAAAGFGGAMIGNSLFGGSAPVNHGSDKKASTSASGYTLEDATNAAMSVQEITEAAKPSVVEIKTESVTSDVWMQQYVTEGAGSGVIVTNDGYIVTNNHVIEGAGKIMVTLADGSEYDAKLIGTDSMTDVAVIKISAKGLTPATYGNSDQLAVGDLAVAIGNPLGELGGTVTAGIISALDRELVIDGQTMTLLQTDSSINPGNSGGGLFNDDGQLIGIVVAKSSGSDVEGLGFAIPINTAADVAQQLMNGGYVKGQPSTGMTYTESGGSSDGFDMFFGGSTSTQVYIYSIEGKNAKKAGFKSGDMVYAVDGEVIESFDDLSAIISKHKVGDKITYTIVRDGYTKDISFELEEKGAQ